MSALFSTFHFIPAAACAGLFIAAGWHGPSVAGEAAHAPIVLAQNNDAVINRLRSRGATVTMTSRAQVMQRAGSLAAGNASPGCGKNACICTGSECLDVISSNKCDADTWHCAPSGEGPVCVCEQK